MASEVLIEPDEPLELDELPLELDEPPLELDELLLELLEEELLLLDEPLDELLDSEFVCEAPFDAESILPDPDVGFTVPPHAANARHVSASVVVNRLFDRCIPNSLYRNPI
jgi:hypothetical protein